MALCCSAVNLAVAHILLLGFSWQPLLALQLQWSPEIVSSPCSPSKTMMADNGVPFAHTLNEGRSHKFFLHNEGALDQKEVVECFLNKINATKANLDDKVFPNDAEHFTDARLLGQLVSHSARVNDTSEATIHFVGATLNVVRMAVEAGLGHNLCTRSLAVVQEEMAAALDQLPEFSQNPENFIFIDTDWRVSHTFGEELLSRIRKGNSMLGAADMVLGSEMTGVDKSRVITMPYVTHYILEAAARERALAPAPAFELVSAEVLMEQRRLSRPTSIFIVDYEDRDISLQFEGNLSRLNEQRKILMTLSEGIQGTVVKDVHFQDYSVEEFAEISRKTAETMLRSVFCLVPEGDTPSNRRLFDALAAGCVPVLFASFEATAASLPFRQSIDWSEVVIFAGSLDCAADEVNAMSKWIRFILSETMVRPVERMRARGLEVYEKYLSYDSPGIVDAMLRESDMIIRKSEFWARF